MSIVDSLWGFCPCTSYEMANKNAMLFYWWIKCHLHFDGCLVRERVLIVLPHNSMFSSSAGPWPTWALVHLSRAPKQCEAAVLLQRATVEQSPKGGVFSNKSVPNLVTALNCLFVNSSMWMSLWLSCGSMDSLCSYLTWLPSGHRQHCLPPPQPQPPLLHHPAIVFLSHETYFLAPLMKREIQDFILALAGI